MARWAAFGFTATVSLLIPAAWHATAADLPADGALVKPPVESFKVKGVEVKVEVDRAAVAPGGEVKLKLLAFADKPQRLALEVREQTTSAMPGDRVEREPETLSKRSVTVTAGPDGGPGQLLSFHLPASRGKKGAVKQYSFLVQPKQQVESEDGEYAAALISVVTHDPEAYSVVIDPPAQVEPGKAFDLTVHVKNPGKKELKDVHVDVAPAPETMYMGYVGDDQLGLQPGESEDFAVKPVSADAEEAIAIPSLAPGEEKVFTYHVEPGKPLPRYAFMATAWSESGGNALDWKAVETAPVAAAVVPVATPAAPVAPVAAANDAPPSAPVAAK